METIEDQIEYMQGKPSEMDAQILKTLRYIKRHYCNPEGENIIISLSKDNWKRVSEVIY